MESEVSKHGGVEKLRQLVRRTSLRFCRWNRPCPEKAQRMPFGHMANEGEEGSDRNEPKKLKIIDQKPV